MKTFLGRLVAFLWVAMLSGAASAAVDQADKLAPEPTVSAGWVVAFLVVFVLFCIGLVIGIYRADKGSKTEDAGKK